MKNKNKVVPILNWEWQNRRREEQIERWLLGQAEESGLFREEDKPEISLIEINLTPKQNNNKK